MRRPLIAAVVLTTAFALALPPASAPAGVQLIDIQSNDYSPDPYTVQVLESGVSWENLDPTDHTATANAPFEFFDTGTLSPNETSASMPMPMAGTFKYHCEFHGLAMSGTLRVPMSVSTTTPSVGGQVEFLLADQDLKIAGTYKFQLRKRRTGGKWRAVDIGNDTFFIKTFNRAGSWDYKTRVVHIPTSTTSVWSPRVNITAS